MHENGIVIYQTHNEGKSVVAARFIRTLKNNIYKCITEISKNVYYVYNDDKLDNIIDRYNNTNQRRIKEKTIDAKPITFIDLVLKAMIKIPNLKCRDLVRILKYKNIFAKIYILSWSEEVSFIKDVKNIVT